MKIVITIIITIALAFAAVSGAETFTTLLDIQNFLLSVEPKEILWGDEVYVNLTGKVVSVPYGSDAFHVYRIECYEEYAQRAYLFDYNPCFYASVNFPEVLRPGDYVRVEGTISAMYSSPLIPFVNASKITYIPD
ncbi:MAG: hypothetical protein IKF99_13835 [Oscillospiraceae bacterium]|nr:hypothetical protein [Oscillospiraceae bacterium]